MDQLTSDLSRISIDKSSTRNEQVLQQLRKWLSDNANINTHLSLIRQAEALADDIATAFMATFTLYEKALPQDVQVYLQERKPRRHSIEEWDLLAKLDLAEFILAMFSSDPSKESTFLYPSCVHPSSSSFIHDFSGGLNDGSEKNRPLCVLFVLSVISNNVSTQRVAGRSTSSGFQPGASRSSRPRFPQCTG